MQLIFVFRIAIARAAYSNTDAILFDDTLSAMDAHVGKHVFDNCFRGLLREKAVIFATNQLGFCSECDYIYVLHDGNLVQHGSFKELTEQEGQFAELMCHVEGTHTHDEAGAVDKAADESAKSSPLSQGALPSAPTTPGSTVSTKDQEKRVLYRAEDAENERNIMKAFVTICR